MTLAPILALTLIQSSGRLDRDSYGVPVISAPTVERGFFLLGKAVAEDRLWQMEWTRRSARGRTSEILGPSAFAGDREVLSRAYTDAELTAMFRQMPPVVMRAWEEYAKGVNETIRLRKAAKSLPEGFTSRGLEPEPWTVLDSAAIAVNLARRFGGGGAGELRNYALYQYLASQRVKDRRIETINDLAWFQDRRALTTVQDVDDKVNPKPFFPIPTRAQTEAHLAQLPGTSVFELAGAAAGAEFQESRLMAEHLGIAHKLGSYAVAVNGKRSPDGKARLLHAPQMGFTTPSVIHESTLSAGSFRVMGMTVPGVPTYLIGRTPDFAWTLTTGVADIEDIYVSKLVSPDTYLSGEKQLPLTSIKFTVKVKGEADRVVVQQRTHRGPVLLLSNASKAVYSLQSAYAGGELQGYADIFTLASRPFDRAVFDRIVADIPVNFNVFYADRRGNIGYRYSGTVPIRPEGIDPRFPLPDAPAFEWRGFILGAQMPHVHNPKGGLIANWNNKPVSWWPNGDTPAWGRLFRNSVLMRALDRDQIGFDDLVQVTPSIGRGDQDANLAFLGPLRLALAGSNSEGAKAIRAWNGQIVAGSVGANLYVRTIAGLRNRLFRPLIGNLTNDSLFRQAVQPSVILNAMEGQSQVDWRQGKDALTLYREVFAEVEKDLSGWPGGTRAFANRTVPWSDRGTYLQITDWGRNPISVNVVAPGNAETGIHAFDQLDLASKFWLKPMAEWR